MTDEAAIYKLIHESGLAYGELMMLCEGQGMSIIYDRIIKLVQQAHKAGRRAGLEEAALHAEEEACHPRRSVSVKWAYRSFKKWLRAEAEQGDANTKGQP